MQFISISEPDAVVEALREGKVAVLPTDTVYGLAALPASQTAVRKIYEIKERPGQYNLPIMVSGIDDLYAMGLDLTPNALALLNSPYIPGALTLVLGFTGGARPEWLNGRDEVAIRIPDNAFMLNVLSKTGPLLVTSANKHRSNINMGLLPEILEDLNGQPDIVVDAGPLSDVASSIANCRYAELHLEREGEITLEQLKKYLHHE